MAQKKIAINDSYDEIPVLVYEVKGDKKIELKLLTAFSISIWSKNTLLEQIYLSGYLFIIWQRKREIQTELYPLSASLSSPSAHNGWGWTRMEPRD